MVKFFLVILFSCCVMLANAQQIQFQNRTMADGLSDAKVYTVGQDRNGFMWLGTNHGLNVYDGNKFRRFFANPLDSTSIPGDDVQKLLFDGDSVWIATRTGLGLMNLFTKECTSVDLGTNTDIRTLFAAKNKTILWVGTSTGLVKYNINDGSYHEFNTENSNLSHSVIRSVYEDLDGNLWIGTFDKLNKLSHNSSVFEIFDLKENYRPGIKNNLILDILPQQENNDSMLWIGTQTGLVLFNRYSAEKQFFREENTGLANSICKTLCINSAGTLWIGTDFGLAEMNPEYEFQVHLHDPFKTNSLVNSIVWDIFEDAAGTLWLGTNNGVSMLPKSSSRFKFFPMTSVKKNNVIGFEVRDILEDTNHNIWLATQFGVVEYDAQIRLLESFNTELDAPNKLTINSTQSLLEDKRGRIWMATHGGLVIWDQNSRKLQNYTANFAPGKGLRSNYVSKLLELNDSTILVYTYKGLHRAHIGENGIEFQFIGKLNPNLVVFRQNLWALKKSRLVRIDTETFEEVEEFDFMLDNKAANLYSIVFTGESTCWIGTENGLFKYDLHTKEHEFFEIKSNKIFSLISLLPDNNGNIWAASYSAILKFSTQSNSFEIYPSGDEIPISRFVGRCCLKKENGDLIFGGHDGFIEFSPGKITKSDFLSPVRFTSLQILNREITPGMKINGEIILKNEIAFTPQLSLNYANRSFSLQFSSLHFGNRNGIRYAYRLDGEDADWTYVNGEVGQASYASLRPGKYVLRVKGTNSDGVWNPQETLMNIRVKPPLWASPLLIAGYFLLLVFIVVAIVYYFSSRSKMLNQLKLARLEKQHTENIAKARFQFFTNISHEFATPLSLIIGPAEKLVKSQALDQKGKDFVRIIENNARRLLWLNNQFLDFSKLENRTSTLRISSFDMVEFAQNVYSLFADKAERKRIRYSFSSEFDTLEVKMDLRKLETILFNLLSNAFKFTAEDGEIAVRVSSCVFVRQNGLCISVEDSGMGIEKAAQQKIFERFYQAQEARKMQRGSGIGLTLAYEYVQMHKGKIEVQSEVGKGSVFQVRFPFSVDYEASNSVVVAPENSVELLKPEKREDRNEGVINTMVGNPVILLVEDDAEVAGFIRISLKNKYNVIVAENGKVALRFVAKQLPDLVISNVNMPEFDGIEFTRRLKQSPKTAHIPVILLSGISEAERQLEGLKSGADAYITKPFEIDMLEVRIDNFLKGRTRLTQHLKRDDLSTPKEVNLASQDEKILERVVACIEKHIANSELNVDMVCQETGMSHSVLYRKIKKLTGQTVSEFIRTVRVRRAEQLLRTKKFSVSEVMYETGFSNHSYFSKCFRKLYKMSPKEYIGQV